MRIPLSEVAANAGDCFRYEISTQASGGKSSIWTMPLMEISGFDTLVYLCRQSFDEH